MTTTISTPETVEITLPESKPTTFLGSEKFITLLLDREKVYQYQGLLDDISVLEDSTAVSNFLKQLKNQHGDSIVVLIKPLESATYKSTVDILDHMTIQKIKKFSMETPNANDLKLATKLD